MGHFQGVPKDKVEFFYGQLILSDITMPHTHNHLSPITFSQFLDRNQIRTYNVLPIYEEANAKWKSFAADNEVIFKTGLRATYDLDLAEQPAENSWHILIDYFRRMLHVKDIKDPYLGMHYMSHVCRTFLEASSEIEDQRLMLCTRAIFTQMTEPVLYPSLVPTSYAFLPVKMYTDATYLQSCQAMMTRVYTYILGHSAQSSVLAKVDETKSKQIKNELHDALTAVVKNKRHEEKVDEIMTQLSNSMKIYKVDQDAYEMADTLVRDGFKSAIAIEELSKLGDKYCTGKMSKDPDDVIDSLLDVWKIVSPPEKKTFLSRVFHKSKPEEMDNDIDAIKRERKFDTP